MDVPTQVCTTCAASDPPLKPTFAMLAALHPTRIQKASYDHVDARGAVAGSKGGERVRFIDWCVQHQHPLPRSFLDMMPKRRKKQTVIQKNTGKRTREAVTAEAGGAAAAAGGAAAAAGRAAAAQPELKLKPDSESADTSTRTWLCRFRLETYAQALDDDGYEDLVCRSCVSDVG